ncbi:MAG: NADP-dependent 3-hydroxy acid dehydrogenase YdfG [Candidatus Azotimanducaceae bacterium]|jgi:NADP-dependent 3-hydroxy acid dehydrogenase YdfG
MTNYLAEKVVIITGAGGGFGRLLCEKIVGLGGSVVAADISDNALNSVTLSLANAPGKILAKVTDVTLRQDVKALAAFTVEQFGSIDVLVNNAGVMPLAFYADHADAEDAWDRCIDINFKGVLNGITAVYDQMIAQGSGHVVNLSSIYGNFPVSGAAVYGATKAAVNFLSESLRLESQGKIKVTTIKPTGVPATGLGSGVINPTAIAGILGANAEQYLGKFQAVQAGTLDARLLNPENIEYYALDPDLLTDQIIYAMNQPLGVSISELTVRASGDAYVI